MTNLLTRRPSTPAFSEAWSPITHLKGLLGWDPFQDFFRADPFANLPALGQDLVPAMQVKETPTTYELKMDVPGIQEENLDVSLSGNRLTISGKRESETQEENETYHLHERRFGTFSRTFTLPEEVDANKIKAELKEGVLCLTLAKPPEARPKKIEVKTRT